jgi:hypothetical protein
MKKAPHNKYVKCENAVVENQTRKQTVFGLGVTLQISQTWGANHGIVRRSNRYLILGTPFTLHSCAWPLPSSERTGPQ